jgi:hypothetical protein
VLPFLILLVSVEWEGEHSSNEKPVGCQFMFKQVIRKKIDGGVSCGGFSADAYIKAGGLSGY